MANYGYIRVSTQTQADKGYGKDTQLEKITAYGTDFEPIDEVFYDLGISGTRVDREGLNRLFSVLQKGDRVIVANTSRLWRSDTAKVLIHHEFKKLGVEVVSIDQPTYSLYNHAPEDFLFCAILEILDQYDRMLINRRLSAGRESKARLGSKPCGSAPYGYKWQGKEIVVDTDKANIVRYIYDKRGEGLSMQKIADQLNLNGVPSPLGNSWTKQTISHILHNDFYRGVVTHKGIKSMATHTPILDTSLANI